MGYDGFNLIEILFTKYGPGVGIVLVFAAYLVHLARYAWLSSNINSVLCDPSLSAAQKGELIRDITAAYKPIVISFGNHHSTH